MKNSLDVAVSALVTAAIVAMAVVLLHREFASSDRTSHLDDQLPPPTFVPEWRELLGSGVRLGDASAPITIVEFADLQCPACRAFHRELQTVLDRWKRKVSVVFVHYPLSNHPSARAAARALECARDQGAFSEYLDVVLDKQDSLGAKSYVSYAQEAGIADEARFVTCASDTGMVAMIEAGLEAGSRIKLQGTPTVLINGWRYPYPPRASLMLDHIGGILRGRQPVRGIPKGG